MAPRALRGSFTVLTVAVFLLVTLGGVVRNAGAGLSCPDWPLCFGRFMPPMDVQVFLEWFHRLIAGTVSTVILGAAALTAFIQPLRARFGKPLLLAVSLLLAQIVLGGLTVLGLLSPKWVVSHLAVGLAFFGTLLFITLRSWDRDEAVAPRSIAPHAVPATLATGATMTLFIVYTQAILGGMVSSNYAALACPDFPTCNGQWWPEFHGLVAYQMLHRLGAAVATVAVLSLFAALYRQNAALSPLAKALKWLLPVLLTAQVTLGILTVLWGLPLPLSVAHLATATLLLSTLLVIRYELRTR
jgi:cytochrome c oxidase assembly protein subunit 15